jgi:hypothetical protein
VIAHTGECPSDVEYPGGEIDILPAQGKEFATP